jgi:hypothetical protein
MDNRGELRNAVGIPKSRTSPACLRKKPGAALIVAIVAGITAIAAAPASAQDRERMESPLSFRIGSAEFTPGGFVDFENVFRTASGTSKVGVYSRYNLRLSGQQTSNPSTAFKVSQAWGRWDCATNAADGAQGCANPFSTSSATNRLQLYWLDLKRGKWEFVQGQPWPVTGSFSVGVGGLISNTQFSTPFSTLRTHANGAVLNFNGTLNTPFLWLNGSASIMPSPLLDAPGSFSETSGFFTDIGRLTSSSINGGSIDAGAKPLSFVVPPVGQSLFPGAIISPFAGYGFFNESLRGTVPGPRNFW